MDDMDIPMPSLVPAYRLGRRREPIDAGTKRLAMIGGALAGAIVLIAGAWALSGHRHGGAVPVVQADARPLRTRPQDRGGMQVQGQDDAILSGEPDGKDTMLPPPEAPQPQTLQAEEQSDRAAAAEAAQAAAQAGGKAAGKAAKSPPAAATQPAAAVAPAAPVARPAPAGKAALAVTAPLSVLGGHAQVQLATVDTEASAMAEWQRLNRRLPDLLTGRQAVVQKLQHGGRTLFRLRTGGFADIATATAFCEKLRAKGAGCTLAGA